MVKVKLEASPRLTKQVYDESFITTKDDLPPEEILLIHYPRVDEIIFERQTGSSWTVIRVSWPINEKIPIVVVE